MEFVDLPSIPEDCDTLVQSDELSQLVDETRLYVSERTVVGDLTVGDQ